PHDVGNSIGLLDHTSHGPNADQANSLLPNELNQFLIREGFCVTIDEQHFVLGRCECLEEKHPQMRHEIACHTIIRVVQKNFHLASYSLKMGFAAVMLTHSRKARQSDRIVLL